MSRARRSRGTLGALVAAAIALAGASHLVSDDRGIARGATAPSYGVTITTKVDARGRGTFTLHGGLADAGRASARRAVVNGRLVTSATLAGAKGRISLTSSQPCARAGGTWRIVSATRDYANLSGRGATLGRARCARPLGPAVVVHRGTVELPPPPLAQPGSYGGRTAQDQALLFDVTPDGRSIANVLVGGHSYECVRSDGLRMRGSWGPDVVYRGPFPIADDRTFSIKPGAITIAGRFGDAGAQGAITISHSLPADAQGRTSTCSGSTTWSVTTPPPPARRALAGTYCGFTSAGGGVCVDVSADGRETRNARAEVVLTCGLLARIPLSVRVTHDQATPLRTDLSFRLTFTTPFEGRTIGGAISGTFDQSGGLTGVVGLAQPTIVRDGVTHVCRSNGNFTARLQR